MMLTYLNALTQKERLNDIEHLINDPETLIGRSVRMFFRVHLMFVRGVKSNALNWEDLRDELVSAKNAAILDKRVDILMLMGEFASQRMMPDVAAEIFKATALGLGRDYRRYERRAFTGWLQASLSSGDTASFRLAAKEGSRRWPDDQTFKENSIYADLLLGENVERRLREAVDLLDMRPDDSARKLIVALGYSRLADPSNTVSYMQNVKLDDVGGHGRQAVYAALAWRCGFADAAKEVEKGIPAGATMLPEERYTLERSRK
jgi:hypothetical protein